MFDSSLMKQIRLFGREPRKKIVEIQKFQFFMEIYGNSKI